MCREKHCFLQQLSAVIMQLNIHSLNSPSWLSITTADKPHAQNLSLSSSLSCPGGWSYLL